MALPWKRLIRFVAVDGRTLRGQPVVTERHGDEFDVGSLQQVGGLTAQVLIGDDIYDTTGKTHLSDEIVGVRHILGPLTQDDVPIIRCIGLNYMKHIREAGRSPPPVPSMFIKPNTAIIGSNEPIMIPRVAQDEQADYEGELCFTLLKDAKDVAKEDALNYMAAFTCGNDVSSRKLQSDPSLAGGVPQWCFSKGFDTFAPLGPCLVSRHAIGDPSQLRLRTVVNGEVRQDTKVSDLLFDCASLLSFLSQGTTLQKHSLIMTGTPGGVGNRMKPPRFLQDGDVVEVEISRIGTLRNMVKYL